MILSETLLPSDGKVYLANGSLGVGCPLHPCLPPWRGVVLSHENCLGEGSFSTPLQVESSEESALSP